MSFAKTSAAATCHPSENCANLKHLGTFESSPETNCDSDDGRVGLMAHPYFGSNHHLNASKNNSKNIVLNMRTRDARHWISISY